MGLEPKTEKCRKTPGLNIIISSMMYVLPDISKLLSQSMCKFKVTKVISNDRISAINDQININEPQHEISNNMAF